MKIQKRLAAQILEVSPNRVKLDETRLEEIDEAITKADVRSLIKDGAITKKPAQGISKVRARHIKKQKVKGLRKGQGSRQGKSTARLPRKEAWMNKVRNQRKLLKELKEKEKISKEAYRDLYNKSKGGFFRSARHIKIYVKEHSLFKKEEKGKK